MVFELTDRDHFHNAAEYWLLNLTLGLKAEMAQHFKVTNGSAKTGAYRASMGKRHRWNFDTAITLFFQQRL
jgi:hypothetical protein